MPIFSDWKPVASFPEEYGLRQEKAEKSRGSSARFLIGSMPVPLHEPPTPMRIPDPPIAASEHENAPRFRPRGSCKARLLGGKTSAKWFVSAARFQERWPRAFNAGSRTLLRQSQSVLRAQATMFLAALSSA